MRLRRGGRNSQPSQSTPWRNAVGGLWDEVGRLQLDFLVTHGLLPSHNLVDVGCGSLRGGVHFIRYLDDGHYHGIDSQAWLLDAGVSRELPLYGLSSRTVRLLCRDDFDLTGFGTVFDFAIAQSVFTHLPWNGIFQCLYQVERALAPQGRFFATFFEAPPGAVTAEPRTHTPGGIVTYLERDPFHYSFDILEDLAHRVGLRAVYHGGWEHPRGQRMAIFQRAGEDPQPTPRGAIPSTAPGSFA